MARLKSRTLTLNRWVQLSRRKLVRESLDADMYLAVYRQLMTYVKELPKPLELRHAVICIHVAYAWMPTILDPSGVSGVLKEQPERLIDVLNGARSAIRPEGIDQKALEVLVSFANNSTVGASKLLHFLNPSVYPIWDSRVAANFLWSGVCYPTLNTVTRFMEYVDTLWAWSSTQSIKDACKALKTACPSTRGFSTVRLIELVLFHASPD